jgi:prevent-host-death family protein
MQIMTVTEIRRRWSQVLTRVHQGEEIIVTRRGKRIGRLRPPEADEKRIVSGRL